MSGLRPPNTSAAIARLTRGPAAGAVVAQVWQACGSFLLQILAAHLLGASGLGYFALCLGAIIIGTAVTSGLVGDSLTILDRHDRATRAGLEVWALLAIPVTSLLVTAALWLTGVLDGTSVALFALASVLFQIEELLRRVIMTTQKFWQLIVVDTSALVTTVAVVLALGFGGSATLGTLLIGLALGQAVGCLTAAALLPATERYAVSLRGAAISHVGRLGLWRGAQVGVTPAVLTAARAILLTAAGAAALGGLEAARMLVAPAVLVIQGLGSYLLTSYVRDRDLGLPALTHRATRVSRALTTATLGLGALVASVVLLVPSADHVVTGSTFEVSPLAVLGWALYAGAVATLQPFASLAAAQHRQRAVFGIRLLDSGVAVLLVWAVCFGQLSTDLVPVALALGPLLGGLLVRRLILRPMANEPCAISTLPYTAPAEKALRSV